MPSIQDDLECHIMYCGEPTIDCCIQSIDNQTLTPSRIVVIEDISPINESINERHRNMIKPFSVKVDADCVLHRKCFEKLYDTMIRKGPKYYAVSGMTLDPFVGIEGGIQLERSDYVRSIMIPDIIGCDRYLRREMEKRGYKFHEIDKVVAEHWSDWSWEAVFKKSMRIGQKHTYFKARYHNWVRNFGKKWLKEKNKMAFIAVLGYCYGLLTLADKEKGKDFAEEEIEILRGLIKSEVIPEPREIYALKGKRKEE